jgi:hypothetical protein
VSDQVKLPDGKRRPVWLTEMGWATHTPHNTVRQDFAPNTLRAQAEFIARSYLCAIVSGVEPKTFWYDFRNDGDDPIYFEHQMGIVHSDFSPKPAYLAYATLTRVLRGKRLVGPVPAPQGVLAFNFKPTGVNSGETIALWSPLADARVELPPPSEASHPHQRGWRAERTPSPGRQGEPRIEERRACVFALSVNQSKPSRRTDLR